MLVPAGEQYARVKMGAWQIDVSCDTLADVRIEHGRQDFTFGQAAMSSASFTVAVPRGVSDYWYVGDAGNTVVIETGPDFGQRFFGHITQLDWDWSETSAGWMLLYKITATGWMSRLGSRVLSGYWPQQTARDRAAAILSQTWNNTDASERWTIQNGDFIPTMLADVERDQTKSALRELEDLSGPAEVIVFDRPDGTVVWQELAHRKTTPIVNLPCDAILFAPSYEQRTDLVNTLTLEYGIGDPRPEVTAYEHNSRFWRGIWAERYETDYANQIEALTKAERVTRRQANPLAVMPNLTILMNQLGPEDYAAVRSLEVGSRVRLPQMPDPWPLNSPQTNGVFVVEGWTEVATDVDDPHGWRLELAVSPPFWSMVSKTWNEMSGRWMDQGSATWDQIGAL